MRNDWIQNACRFGIEFESFRHEDNVSATIEQLATWLTANPTGSYEDWRKEQHA